VNGTNSDLCKDVIICASTVDEQQACYLTENHMGPSAILDLDFLGHVDPALRWPEQACPHAQQALSRPRRRRSHRYG
jgi:hypothetical protein